MTESRSIRFDGSPLTIEDVCLLAETKADASLSDDPAFRARIRRGSEFLERLLREDGVVYGVTTGYGDSCTVVIPPALVAELPHHLFAYHGVGLGRMLDPAETRAVLAARLQARGEHGTRLGRIEHAPQAGTVIGEQVVRQFGHQLGRDHDRARIAIAGGHAVDDAVLAQQALEEVGTAADARAERGIGGKLGARLARREATHVLDGQAVAVEGDETGISHGALALVERRAPRVDSRRKRS